MAVKGYPKAFGLIMTHNARKQPFFFYEMRRAQTYEKCPPHTNNVCKTCRIESVNCC